jgi:methylenetetrahydrofolate reductase (NADPH)
MSSRYEILPFGSAEAEAASAGRPLAITVTCSPRHGVDHTLDVAARMAQLGHQVVPHIAARTIRDIEHLDALLERLAATDIGDVFLIAGDSTEPTGPFDSAVELLPLLARHPQRPRRIGVAAYPEGHPLIDPRTLRQSLERKAQLADYIVTQMCFDSEAVTKWLLATRADGVALPVYVGLPGDVDRRRLLEVSMRVGVGTSIGFCASSVASAACWGDRTSRPSTCTRRSRRSSARLDSASPGCTSSRSTACERRSIWRASSTPGARPVWWPMLDTGHIPSQIAACDRAAGLAVVPRAPLLELRGPATSLASLTARLTGGRHRPGRPVRVRCGWWQAASAHRALMLADAGTPLDTLVDDLALRAPDVAIEDLSAGHACVVLAGPLAGRLASDPAARLARPLMTVCDGDQHRLLVVPEHHAHALERALLESGRGEGVIAVEPRAAELRRVARHHRIA